LRIDPESALRLANGKFAERFGCMEALARARNLSLPALTPQSWEALWVEAKEALAQGKTI